MKQPGGLIEFKCMLSAVMCVFVSDWLKATLSSLSPRLCNAKGSVKRLMLQQCWLCSAEGRLMVPHDSVTRQVMHTKEEKRQLRAADNRDFVLFCMKWCTANRTLLIINCRRVNGNIHERKTRTVHNMIKATSFMFFMFWIMSRLCVTCLPF